MCICIKSQFKGAASVILPVVPVLHLVGVKLRYVHVLGLPGRLVIRQLSPLDQVVDVVLPVHTGKHSKEKEKFTLIQVIYMLGIRFTPEE